MQAPLTNWLEKHPDGAVALLLDADGDDYERTEVTHDATLPELDDLCVLTIAENEGQVAS